MKAPPSLDLDPAIERKLLAWLLSAALLVVGLAALAIQNNTRHAQGVAWINQTHAFISETDAILSSLYAAEAAQRTFLLTGDATANQAAADYLAETSGHLDVATKLALDNPERLDRLGAISGLLQTRLDANKEAIRLLTQHAPHPASLFTSAHARASLQAIEQKIAANRAAEYGLLQNHEESLQRRASRTELAFRAGAAFNIALLLITFCIARIDLKRRRAATTIIEAKIRERAVLLNSTNEKLQVEKMEQKWGQAALQRVVHHHELVLNSIQEGVFIISRSGQIISANPAAADLARREATQLAGKPIASLLISSSEANTWEQHFLAKAVNAGRPIDTRPARFKQADGSIRRVQITCRPTHDAENLTGAVVTVRSQSPMQ